VDIAHKRGAAAAPSERASCINACSFYAGGEEERLLLKKWEVAICAVWMDAYGMLFLPVRDLAAFVRLKSLPLSHADRQAAARRREDTYYFIGEEMASPAKTHSRP
jgi:hypothetical protein